jgi:hypothetical protein
MQKDYIYFSENGLTSTSANHIANLAKEYYQTLTMKLENIKFYDEKISLISSSDYKLLRGGITLSTLEEIKSDLYKIADAKSLIAWLREAIKAKDNLLKELKSISLAKWCTENNIDYPEIPEMEDIMTEDEYLSTLSVKERNRFFFLQTICSVLGQYIHPNGTYSHERKSLKNKMQNPNSLSGSGRDAILYSYTPTISLDSVDELFFELQAKHREFQAELNGMLHKMQQAIDADEVAKRAEHTAKMNEYGAFIEKYNAEYRKSLKEKEMEISKLKIIIPNSLTEIYDKVSALGK